MINPFKILLSSFHYGYAMKFMDGPFEDIEDKEHCLKVAKKHVNKANKWSSGEYTKITSMVASSRLSSMLGHTEQAITEYKEAQKMISSSDELNKDKKLSNDLKSLLSEIKANMI